MSVNQAQIRDNGSWFLHGKVYSGIPEPSKLPEELQYKDPLSNYEVINFNVSIHHKLCHRCYDKLFNSARFGLCVNCYNDDRNFHRLIAVDAKSHKIYLSRRGAKIKLIGDMLRVPIREDRIVVGYRRVMFRPYVDVTRLATFGLDVDPYGGNVKCHGCVPLEYVLAELD